MRADDEADYVEYVTARLPALQRTAYLLCGDAHQSDDIVQTTLTSLYRHWRRARAADNIDTYVHRMLGRVSLDEKRGRWSRVSLLAEAPEAMAAPGPSVEERDAVERLLVRLPYAQRAVLVLRFACDLSVEETAATLRCSAGNVKSLGRTPYPCTSAVTG